MATGERVLVTGAGGFIGSHLAELLVTSGYKVRALVKYNGRSEYGMLADVPPDVLQSIEIVHGNVCDPFAVQRMVHGCSYVFHLAALIGIPYSYIAPSDYVQTNMLGTLNILEACRREEVARLVHTSTSEVYGSAQYVPIDEQHPLQAQSPYAASKIAADKLVESYFNTYHLPAVIVRPFNTFGPRQSARAYIPSIIVQALRCPCLRMGSLEPVRDMTYVGDTAEGFVTVGLHDAVVGQTVNLGTGVGQSVGEVAALVLRLLGKQHLPIHQDPQRVRPRKSEVTRLVSNNTIAATVCKWVPRHSLEGGLNETIAWIKAHMHLFRPDAYAV